MTVTVQQFRTNFPAFTSTTMYPDGSVSFWLNYAYMFLGAGITGRRWGIALDLGAQMFTAHNVTLDFLGASEGANGAPSGMTTGPVVSKTVGDLTITYDVASGVNEADQHWSLTNYGTRFIKMARQFGTGPFQSGIGRSPPGIANGQPWPGPLFENYSG